MDAKARVKFCFYMCIKNESSEPVPQVITVGKHQHLDVTPFLFPALSNYLSLSLSGGEHRAIKPLWRLVKHRG